MDSWSSLRDCTNTKLAEEQTQSDRLSCLPNKLLIHILSLLPTKFAFVVCVLLNKWMLLPLMTSLNFDASPLYHCVIFPNHIERLHSFLTFVDSVLQTHQSPSLTRFRLDLGNTCLTDLHCIQYGHKECLPYLKPAYIDALFAFPLSCSSGLKVLDLRLHLRGTPNQTQIPPQIFMIETLEVLKLSVSLSFDGVSTFRLPNLRTLHIHALSTISEDDFVTRLVSSCPLLENLYFAVWRSHGHFTKISSPSLRKLSLIIDKLKEDENSDLVLLDTPNLEDLVYTDNVALQYSITNMPRLVNARISLTYEVERKSKAVNCQLVLNFINDALSNVHHLSLDGLFDKVFSIINDIGDYERLPVFHNLKLLMVYSTGLSEINILLAFLFRSPNLETLVISGRIHGCYASEYYGTNRLKLENERLELTPSTIPCCCRYNMKRVLIYDYQESDDALLYIQFLLRYLLVLEELVVFTIEPNAQESKLQNLHRASPTCSVQLQVHPSGHFPLESLRCFYDQSL